MKKEHAAKMGPIEAVNYLKKMGEHQTILKNDTDTLIKWAIFLKNWAILSNIIFVLMLGLLFQDHS